MEREKIGVEHVEGEREVQRERVGGGARAVQAARIGVGAELLEQRDWGLEAVAYLRRDPRVG